MNILKAPHLDQMCGH